MFLSKQLVLTNCNGEGYCLFIHLLATVGNRMLDRLFNTHFLYVLTLLHVLISSGVRNHLNHLLLRTVAKPECLTVGKCGGQVRRFLFCVKKIFLLARETEEITVKLWHSLQD